MAASHQHRTIRADIGRLRSLDYQTDAIPVLTHGWPGSVVEFLDVLPLLSDACGVPKPGHGLDQGFQAAASY